MTKGKFGLLAGVAVLAVSTSLPAFAQDESSAPTNAELQARLEALEAEVQQSEMNAANAANAPAAAPTGGWWDNTSISGRMYWDTSSITHKTDGTKAGNADNGIGFDIKRFYVGIDHTFSSIFSADVTTDVTYDSATAASQVFIKKAYLQAKIDPALIIRVGSADLPWVPYVEGIYGYRYLENTLIDRTKFGTSADWGVHVLGSLMDGIVNYDVAAINGDGYKKIPIGGGANRSKDIDLEGRLSAAYDGFNVAVGGYTGELGTPYGKTAYHKADRFDLLGAYVANGLRVGVEYFNASNYSASLVQTDGPGDSAHGWSTFASYNFTPQWGVFGRLDKVDPNARTTPDKEDTYYTFGVSWTPLHILDLSLAYKHDNVDHGTLSTSNGTIGGTKFGSYNEVGIFGDFQW